MATTNIIISGVGGQGILLASKVLADVALRGGHDVKQSEVHGMSQRGGNVVSMVRFGARVASPLIVAGEADILLAFEEMEGLRYVGWLRPGGRALLNRQRIQPSTVGAGIATYPSDVQEKILRACPAAVWVDATEIALDLGNLRVANVVLLGAVSTLIAFPSETWTAALRENVPVGAFDLNIRAFRLGQELCERSAPLVRAQV